MLKEKIQADLITAMKARDDATVRTLRMVKTAIMRHETSAENMVADDAKIISIFKKERAQREDSIEQFEKGGREDLAKGEREEIEVLKRYLPEEMPYEQVCDEVKKIIAETGASSKADMGKVMGAVMGKLRGQADGSVVRKAVEELLK